MALDAGMLSFLLREINERLSGGRVEKIYQPARDEIIFMIRREGETSRLLINAGSACPRIGITEIKSENPAKAPMFCMLLRKHFQGARFLSVEQIGFDRIARLHFEGTDEMGFTSEKHVIVEIMGKYANIIVTDSQDKILSLLRQVDFSQSLSRQLFVGMRYTVPVQQDRRNPLEIDRDTFQTLAAACAPDRPAQRFIMSTFSGIAPLTAREIAYRCAGAVDASMEACASKLADTFHSVMECIRNGDGKPILAEDKETGPIEFSFLPLTQYGSQVHLRVCKSFGELLDQYYGEKGKNEKLRQRGADLLRIVSQASARITKKLALQREEMEHVKEGETFRLWGDLITANIYKMQRGASNVTLENYMDGTMVEIPLDSRLTPAQNAQKYYKKYAKSKSAAVHLVEQLEAAHREQAYIQSVQDALSRAETEKELNEIRQELYHSGYASKMKHYTEKKQSTPSYVRFKTSGGYSVLCGKNNAANDFLTFHHAQKGDWWFHAKNTPGSHVILECAGMPEPPAQDFTEAAVIAAVYSKAGEGAAVEVDYTRVGQVKKPAGAKPGFVIYHTNWSATVVPDRKLVESLRI
ncbi:MAG: NFACT family protein [Clostridiales bacterium]|nr:NFACT family protein [Clostridiales bacterium]